MYFSVEFEKKGLDYWWNLILVTKDGSVINIGRGIVPADYWRDFVLTVFDKDMYFIERRL